MTRAVDCSNFTGPLSQDVLTAWRDQHDVGLVIIQSINPPMGYPTGVTRQQIEACAQAGIPTDVYLYLWTNSQVEADMRAKLGILQGLEHLVRKVWLDVEDVNPASVEARISAVERAFVILDGWAIAFSKPTPGLYSARWYWGGYMDNTQRFRARPLWTAQYDGVADADVATMYGGWTACRIKQYEGDATLAGETGIDLNVLSDEEAAELRWPITGEPSAAEFRQAMSYLRHDVLGPLESYKYPRIKAALAEANRVFDQYGAA